MAAGDVAQLVIQGRLHGSETNNVMHFKANDLLASLAGAAQDLFDCVRSTLLPSVSADWSLEYVRAKIIYPVPSDEILIPGINTDKGTLGDALPSFNAGLISLRTGLGGRSKRGRIFIPGMAESAQTASRLSAGEIALLAAFAACLASKFVGGIGLTGWNLGVLSAKNKKLQPANVAAWFTPVTTLIASDVVATMHSRKLGQGS